MCKCGRVSRDDLPEFIGQIIDVFEDFLEDRGVSLNNNEHDGDPDSAIIYGTDYGCLQDGIEDTLVNWGICDPILSSQNN